MVFPAHAGVFLFYPAPEERYRRFPRSRGGVSKGDKVKEWEYEFSPLTRGCFYSVQICEKWGYVFPAHAGVFPYVALLGQPWRCFPRSRGGVSCYALLSISSIKFSPLTRGCFLLARYLSTDGFVFPAHAGVFLRHHFLQVIATGFPRSRGGVIKFLRQYSKKYKKTGGFYLNQAKTS